MTNDSSQQVKEWEINPNRAISPEWLKKAYCELGETEDLRSASLVEFKQLVQELPDCVPRLDEDFLVRFLRAKKYDKEKALRMYRNFFRVRLLDPKIYSPVGIGPKDVTELYKLNVGFLLKHRNPINGACTIVWQFGDWTPETGYDLSHVYTPTSFAIELALRDPEVQLNGFMFLINLINLEWRFLKVFGINAVRALISTAQDGYPARFKGAHIVNQSHLWNIIWGIARPFLSYKIRDRVHLHGSNMESLHEHIDKSILPSDFGGDQPPMSSDWFTKELYQQHDDFVKNSHYGYGVNNKDSDL